MLFTDQLVLLPTSAEAHEAAACALDRSRRTPQLCLRDAAALARRGGGEPVVTELAAEWDGRRRLDVRWWTALVWAMVDHRHACSRILIDAQVSTSFLAEAAEALADELTLVALLAEQVEVSALLREVGGEPFLRVIYGSLPEPAIDDLAEIGVGR
jgi:hypothetical protein